jgi:hypothetical protein
MSKNSFKNNLKNAKVERYASTQDETEHPFFGGEVYENLPECIKPFLVFSSAREKDIFLHALLPALGISLFNVSGLYDGRKYFPALFSVTCAPAASGKGVQNYIHDFLSVVEDAYREKYAETLKLNRISMPANSSAAAVGSFMHENCLAMINETEIDELVNTINQDWGDFTTVMRRGFQHEKIQFNRKDGGYFSIDCPKLSIALAGTKQQYINLFRDADNGTFSRFANYMFTESSGFRDVRPKPGATPYADLIAKATENLLPLLYKINAQPVNFKFREDQWDRFVNRFQELSREFSEKYGDSAIASLMRIGVIHFRVAMILATLRAAENDQLKTEIYCTEEDFINAGRFTKVYMYNFMAALKMMPGEAVKINNKGEHLLYDLLPEGTEFTATDAKRIAKENGIGSERSADNYLKSLRDKGLLIQEKQYGPYKKAPVS